MKWRIEEEREKKKRRGGYTLIINMQTIEIKKRQGKRKRLMKKRMERR